MEYNEEDFLPLGGIQHFTFCPRQWEENLRTLEGGIFTEQVYILGYLMK